MTNKETFHLYSKEEKLVIVNDFINNKLGYRECAQKYGISPASLYYWIKFFRSIGEDGLVSQIGKHRGPNKGRPKGSIKPRNRLEELEKENLNLKIQIERLKKGYVTKGAGSKKEFVTINNKNIK